MIFAERFVPGSRRGPARRVKKGMRQSSIRIAAALVIIGTASAIAQNPTPRDNARQADRTGTGVIRGRVVTADRVATPIRNARVSIAQVDVAEPVFTDSTGRFTLSALPAGRYALVAEKTGFARARHGAINPLDPGMPIDVRDGAIVDGIEVRMMKGAAIVGGIVDEAGDPVVGATVSVNMPRTVGSELTFVTGGRATETDDRGVYRLGDLAPGRYYVSVAGASEGARITNAPEEWARTSGWARTFYPGVPSAAAATPIALGPGEERTAVDFVLAQSKPAKLTLSLADASGAPAKGLINLFLPDETGSTILDNRGVPIGLGAKMTPTLPPGEWVAAAVDGGKALAHVKLSSGEEASLTLMIGAGGRIAGRVVFDGSSRPPPLGSVRIAVRGAGIDRAAIAPALSNGPAVIKPDGSFELTGAVGTIQIAPNQAGRWTMRSATYGDHDLLDDPLTLTGNEDIRDVLVVYTDQLAEITAIVNDADGHAVPGCAVALFPDGVGAAVSRRTALVRADQNGRVTFTGLLSGSYLAAAAPNIDASAWLSADSLDRLRSVATRVTLADHDKKSLTFSCGSAP